MTSFIKCSIDYSIYFTFTNFDLKNSGPNRDRTMEPDNSPQSMSKFVERNPNNDEQNQPQSNMNAKKKKRLIIICVCCAVVTLLLIGIILGLTLPKKGHPPGM